MNKTDLHLGFIPLTDCCVLVVAKEKGYFDKYGLSVTLSKEASWANIRDKVCLGALDGAHMLAPMPIATTLGLGFDKKAMLTAFSMDLNGNAITVSNELHDRMTEIDPEGMKDPRQTAKVLKKIVDLDKKSGNKPLTFAMVYPYSKHNYEIRYWMASGGVHPDLDVKLVVIPPPYMVDNLRTGLIDGFCVGNPWNAFAVKKHVGKVLITSYEIWNNSPEKVFGVTREWAEKNPDTHKSLLKALIEAAGWADQPENRIEVAKIISREEYVDVPEDIIKMSLGGTFQYSPDSEPVALTDFNVFNRYLANFPWCSHAMWFITQMIRWGQVTAPINIRKLASGVYRPNLYREAAGELGLLYPEFDSKTEGTHPDKWQLITDCHRFEMGPDTFMDNRIFDPGRLPDYLFEDDINQPAFGLDQLTRQN